nr:MAG TPA: hypothetical protein [Caudoviricetes sp.]
MSTDILDFSIKNWLKLRMIFYCIAIDISKEKA